MNLSVMSIIKTSMSAYRSANSIKKLYLSLGLYKDYLKLKWINPEVFVSFEKLFILKDDSSVSLDKLQQEILSKLNLKSGVEKVRDKLLFESNNTHVKYELKMSLVDTPEDEHRVISIISDSKLYFPFKNKSILNYLVNEVNKLSEIVSSFNNYKRINEIIKLKLNIENIDEKTLYKYSLEESKVTYNKGKIQINSKHRENRYSLIVSSIVLLYLRFPKMKFKRKKGDLISES